MADIKDIRNPRVLNLDSAPDFQKELETFFIKNMTDKLVQDTAGNFSLKDGLLVPLLSNKVVCVEDILPQSGVNRCIGSYESKLTNECYYFNHNSNNNHGIYKIDSDGCTQVYLGSCLNFQWEEKYAIAEHRVYLALVSDSNDEDNRNIYKKFLIFTDGYNPIRFIDVETSIATDSFNSVTFPYWKTFYPHCDPCEFIELATRPPYDCPKVELIDSSLSDDNLTNKLLSETFQFRYRYLLTDGRVTTFSPISELIYVPTSACENGVGLQRCIKLTLNAGSPLVEKIQIAFRNCNGDANNPDTPTDWFLYDTIDKYDSCVEGTIFTMTEEFCLDAAAELLVGIIPDGVFSGAGVVPFGGDYYFDPATAGAGVTTVTYTVGLNVQTVLVTVYPLPVVTLTPFASVTVATPAFALTGGLPLGGTYSGTGVAAGIFTPATAGVGDTLITYVYVDENGCEGFAQQPITVTA